MYPRFMDDIQTQDTQGRVADARSGHWVYRLLPRGLWPYAQLARWDRSIGWQLLLWPCLWSTALAASAGAKTGAPLLTVLPSLWHIILFTIGAIAMRGAGCTWNDLIDTKIDAQVERTRSRPLPSGQVSRKQALIFLAFQALTGLAVLLQFNRFTVLLGISSLAIVAIYPFMKRITSWPQAVLGLAFSWGALVGWAALNGEVGLPAVLLYIGTIFWVIGYDTIYAHQDKEDDALVGVRSTARLFGSRSKEAITALYGLALMFMAGAFASAEVPMPALAGLLAAGSHMWRQTRTLDIDNPDQCLRLFKSNSVIGLLIFAGLIGGAVWVSLRPV